MFWPGIVGKALGDGHGSAFHKEVKPLLEWGAIFG